MSITLILLLAITGLYFTYDHFARELREVDPSLLEHQTSISETRQASESAIYRSVDVPHGTSITRGLSLRTGYKIRDGCLKDIWFIGFLDNIKDSDAKLVTLGEYKFTLAQINAILQLIAEKLNERNIKNIALFGNLSKNPELLLLLWACFFIADIKVVHYSKKEDFNYKDTDLKTLVTLPNSMQHIPAGTFEEILALDFDNKNSNDNTNRIQIPSNIKPLYKYEYNPDTDFSSVNNHPYSTVVNGNEVKFFQINFVSAVASRLLSAPVSNQWTSADHLLISFSDSDMCNKSTVFESLCGIMANVKSIHIVTADTDLSLKLLSQYQTTIMSTDSHVLKGVVNNNKKSFWQSFKLQRSEYFNSLGYFNTLGKLDPDLRLKTTYVYQLPPPLSSFICNLCKSVLGCRIVREIHCDYSIGPILKTNIFDFRIIQKGSLQLFGVPANSVELKTVDVGNKDSVSRLFVRGMATGKSNLATVREDYWIDTEIEGSFSRDGCFYGRL